MLLRSLAPLLIASLVSPQDGGASVPDAAGAAALAQTIDCAPGALHLGSFGTRLGARLRRDGALDTGAVVLALLDGEGRPLDFGMRHGPGPDLWAVGGAELDGVAFELRAVADEIAVRTPAGLDRRLKAVLRVTLENGGSEPRLARFGVRLSPGGGDPALRPLPSLPFPPGGGWSRDGELIARDGACVLGWIGAPPSAVELAPSVASPDDAACLLRWELSVPPGGARYLDLCALGPRVTPAGTEASAGAEAEMRAGLVRWPYHDVAEQTGWLAASKGLFSGLSWAKPGKALRMALVMAVQQLRAFGRGGSELLEVSDRPYGHPPSDAAASAEIVAAFVEWGFGDWAQTLARAQVEGGLAAGGGLPAERRVAMAHALARIALLIPDPALQASAARAVRGLATQPAAVAPWLDPEVVRQDLADLLLHVDPDAGDAVAALPQLAWPETASGSAAGRMQQARRAISAGDGGASVAALIALAGGADPAGVGALVPGGEAETAFALGLLSLMRAALVDDGPEPLLFPALDATLLPDRDVALDVPILPTQAGPLRVQVYTVGRQGASIMISPASGVLRQPLRARAPHGFEIVKVNDSFGSTWTLLADGTLRCEPKPDWRGKINVSFRIRR